MRKMKLLFIALLTGGQIFVGYLTLCEENLFALDDLNTVSLPADFDFEDTCRDICPHGLRTVCDFLDAWGKRNYSKMYTLLDIDPKTYTYQTARLDFEFMKFKEYTISSVRKSGKNYEFFLSFGDWKDGNKDLKKLLINGKNFKIMLYPNGEILKESIESYNR